jgi:hypothetical protein
MNGERYEAVQFTSAAISSPVSPFPQPKKTTDGGGSEPVFQACLRTEAHEALWSVH